MSFAIQEIASRGQMQPGYLWKFRIPDSPVAGMDKLEFQARTTTIPGLDSQKISYRYQNGQIHYPGPQERGGELTVTMLVAEDMVVYDAVRAWQNLTGDEVTGLAVPRPELVRTAFVKTQSVSGDVTKEFKYQGFWIKTVGELSLDQESTDHLTCDVTFSFDYMEPGA